MEITNLQTNKILKEKFNNIEFSIFHSKYIDLETYPNLQNNALKMMSLFGSTYTCEHIFSRIKIIKPKTRTQLTDIHLKNSLRIASSKIQPSIKKLVSEKQCQLSH